MSTLQWIYAGLAVSIVFVCLTTYADDIHSDKRHRAFQPVTRPSIPPIRGKTLTDIDRFILHALEEKQLIQNPEADRSTLIRRVSFDLTGLPPTVSELDAFLQDKTPDAYCKMIDRYLASPRYGERWGKYWLDAAGYADSNGYFNADSDRPLAWRYRDYVINSFNTDKPYDLFVREQLAGDEQVCYSPDADVTPEMVEKLVATHFLRNAPDGSGESDGNPEEVRTDRFTVLEGNVQNMMNCLLGLTVQCARCHDHKFEPISQKEYYSLQAILFSVYNPDRWAKPNERIVSVGKKAELTARQRLSDQIDQQVKALKTALSTFTELLREQHLDERVKHLDFPIRKALLEALKIAKDKRSNEQKSLLKAHAKTVEISDAELANRFPEYAAFRDQISKSITAREKERPSQPEKIAAFVETDPNPALHHILKRGQHGQPGSEVQPGVLAVLSNSKNPYKIDTRPAGQVTSGRRTAFARWVTSSENPLFARVMVNRIWQHHFGTGIVATVENLGISGAKPSHPDLLDFLASEFVKQRWSIKQLHRLIMTSSVYKQSSMPRDDLSAIDPDNRLLAKFPLRRLDAEAIRDAMLHIAGELDYKTGGPYVPSKRTDEGAVEVEEKSAGAHRRSVYLQQRRTQVVTFLQLFDAPSMVTTCGIRSPTTVPLQSLALLNSGFARDRSKSLATRLVKEAGTDPGKQLEYAYRLICGRSPLKDELIHCLAFLAKQKEVYTEDKEHRSLVDLCQMLFASSAFMYVE